MTRSRTFQAATVTTLRQIHKENSIAAKKAMTLAQKQLAVAGAAAARARDIAVLLAEADPEWTQPEEAPAMSKASRIQAWRELLDFIEQHPEITMESYESFTICPADGSETTVEWIESLKNIGLDVTRGKTSISAELSFGDIERARIRTWAKVPEPEPEPVDAVSAAMPDGQQLRAGNAVIIADPGAVVEIKGAHGLVAHVPFDGSATVGVEVEDPFSKEPTEIKLEVRGLRSATAPIRVGDRVCVHSADDEAPRDFPEEFEDCEGEVVKVEPGAFTAPADAVDANELPIEVVLNNHPDAPQCFAVAEVTVTTFNTAANADELVGAAS